MSNKIVGSVDSGNKLYFGDNLDVLRKMPAESVDLIYLDPPFNSKADYGVIYGTKRGASQAQSHAFKDMWTWGRDAQQALNQTAERHLEAGALLDAFQRVFPQSNMLAYLSMMAVRLIEMQRVLKESGSLYLHCDPTASHYLKVLLDTIFLVRNFRNEIIWKRTTAHSDGKRCGRIHDTLLFYSKSDDYTWNDIYQPYDADYVEKYYRYKDEDGRKWASQDVAAAGAGPARYFKGILRQPPPNSHWRYSQEKIDEYVSTGRIYFTKNGFPRFKRYLDDMPGMVAQDIWADKDVQSVVSWSSEGLGYATQKPIGLLKRIILASSNEGEIILDPFCGCGTAIHAAQTLKRQWIGIDVTYLAIHVIEGRLVKAFGPEIKDNYKLLGRPEDADDARALAARDWLEFQKWAVFSLGGLPKDKPGADGGIDGIIRYHRVGIEQPNRAVVSVKGGQHIGVDAVHKLKSVVKREGAELGILVCLDHPTPAMEREALSEGDVGPASKRVPKLQIVTVEQIFARHPIELPGTLDPPEISRLVPQTPNIKKRRKAIEGQTEMIFPLDNPRPPTKPEKRGKRQFVRLILKLYGRAKGNSLSIVSPSLNY